MFDITLVITLYPMLRSEIGQNLLKEFAPFSLGMRARNVEFVQPPIF